MLTLSAFADEIDPDPERQVEVLTASRIRFIELRSINKINVLDLSDLQVRALKTLLDSRGIGVSAIGSPIGKIRVDEPFAPHLQRFERAMELAKEFDTRNIRVFSYYPADGESEKDWPARRSEVLLRTAAIVERVQVNGLRLFHENEHRVYGDSPDRVRDLLDTFELPTFAAAFDPANFVVCGFDAWESWRAIRNRVAHLHIKDWQFGEERGRLAGQGQGRVVEILTDAVQRNYDGFAVLEPHLLGGGPTGGATGPELFPKAVNALRSIIQQVGGQERMS